MGRVLHAHSPDGSITSFFQVFFLARCCHFDRDDLSLSGSLGSELIELQSYPELDGEEGESESSLVELVVERGVLLSDFH